MNIEQITIDGFKNLNGIQIAPQNGYNLVVGDNAQGKTNLLEAIWILTGCKSFRKIFDDNDFRIEIVFNDSKRIQKINYNHFGGSSKIFINEIEVKKKKELFDLFKCVIFVPSDIELVDSMPEVRRKFFDHCIFQYYSDYLTSYGKFRRAAEQKNILLKNGISDNQMDVWDKYIAEFGTEVACFRKKFIDVFNTYCDKIYNRINESEVLKIRYKSNIFDGNEEEFDSRIYLNKLLKHREKDFARGFTGVGVNRDDYEILLNSKPAKFYSSQGQKKSIALVLKLSLAEIIAEIKNEFPIILLDDILGELDKNRQSAVLKMFENRQVFITTCSEFAIENAKKFSIKDGKIT
jgi:DNA replication and repair protein RecF